MRSNRIIHCNEIEWAVSASQLRASLGTRVLSARIKYGKQALNSEERFTHKIWTSRQTSPLRKGEVWFRLQKFPIFVSRDNNAAFLALLYTEGAIYDCSLTWKMFFQDDKDVICIHEGCECVAETVYLAGGHSPRSPFSQNPVNGTSFRLTIKHSHKWAHNCNVCFYFAMHAWILLSFMNNHFCANWPHWSPVQRIQQREVISYPCPPSAMQQISLSYKWDAIHILCSGLKLMSWQSSPKKDMLISSSVYFLWDIWQALLACTSSNIRTLSNFSSDCWISRVYGCECFDATIFLL